MHDIVNIFFVRFVAVMVLSRRGMEEVRMSVMVSYCKSRVDCGVGAGVVVSVGLCVLLLSDGVKAVQQ
jgi:hypothetical protein